MGVEGVPERPRGPGRGVPRRNRRGARHGRAGKPLRIRAAGSSPARCSTRSTISTGSSSSNAPPPPRRPPRSDSRRPAPGPPGCERCSWGRRVRRPIACRPRGKRGRDPRPVQPGPARGSRTIAGVAAGQRGGGAPRDPGLPAGKGAPTRRRRPDRRRGARPDCRRGVRRHPAEIDPRHPRLGCINVHASLLPKYRGAAPINWAVARGETVTGITIMRMDEGMDTGPMLHVREMPIGEEDTAETMFSKLSLLGPSRCAKRCASCGRRRSTRRRRTPRSRRTPRC